MLEGMIVLFKRLAAELDQMDPREENFIVTLLLRHCQSRMGLDALEKFGGKPPDDPEKCLKRFKQIATDLEQSFSVTDETFLVNCLQQAWQRRAAITLEELQATVNEANKETVQ